MIVRCYNVQKYLKGRMKNDLDLSIILNQGASWKQARFVLQFKATCLYLLWNLKLQYRNEYLCYSDWRLSQNNYYLIWLTTSSVDHLNELLSKYNEQKKM